MKATAQAKALNDVLANEEAMWKKRYQDAYRAYQKSAYDKAQAAQVGSQNTIGGVEYEDTTGGGDSVTVEGIVPGISGGYTVANVDTETGEQLGVTGVPYGGEYKESYVIGPTKYNNYMGHGAGVTGNYKNGDGHWVLEYSLPSGKKVTTGWGETLKYGSDGDFYVYNTDNNSYTNVGR